MRHIVHLHIPAFPVAVARVREPGLRGWPVAVVPPRSDRALILSASAEAREEGVFKGLPLSRALKRCPHLKVVPPDLERMERASHALSRTAAHYTPLWESARPGHVYLDLTGTERLWGRARDTAFRLRREIQQRMDLTGTVGVAANKMVSSIASRFIPLEEVVDVDPGREAPFLAPLRVGVVPGIGPIRQRLLLEELNIFRVGELAVLDMGHLQLIFGRQAFLIHQRTRGIDPTPVFPSPRKPILKEEIVFSEDENDDERLLGALYRLVERCAHRLRQRSLCPRQAGLLIRYSDQVEVRRQGILPRVSCWEEDLYGPMERLFFRACRRRVRVRFMGVWFRGFEGATSQLSLFPSASPNTDRNSRVIQALDRIRQRHGEDAIKYGRAA